jgi:hypothetical protein
VKQTQTEMVYDALKANREGITARYAREQLGVDRLAARIDELRDQNIWIDTNMVRVPTRHGFAHVAKYRLISPGKDVV